MLGLPVLTAMAGFQPSLLLFFLAWVFMATTGLLLLEVNLWFPNDASLISMTKATLGSLGKWVCWGTFLFLFYSALVAYITASGDLFSDFMDSAIGIHAPLWTGSLLFTLLFAFLIYWGTGAVDRFNRLLMAGLILAYVLLLVLGAPHVNQENLQQVNWKAALLVIPPMVFSFGYHNLVPSLTTYLARNRRQMILSILIGSAIPLAVYLAWEWLILGIIPLEGSGGFLQALDEGHIATHALTHIVGSLWVSTAAQAFAFFAIVTSFLGVSLSFVDFLSDGLGIPKDRSGKLILCTLTLGPPFGFALLYPKIFLIALNYASAFGAVILFGILPALMVWQGRYRQGKIEHPIVPGGRFVLLLVIVFSGAVTLLQLASELGWTP
jgi:tyrosine-specific transport protein